MGIRENTGPVAIFMRLFTWAMGLYLGWIVLVWIASEAKLYWTFHIEPPQEFNHCILNRMPSVANDAVFEAAYSICKQLPARSLKRYSTYRIPTAEYCVIHFGNGTTNFRAAVEINNACHSLFKPTPTKDS